jgi:uncharacterized protein involved in exopolysaccharide biosynthesis
MNQAKIIVPELPAEKQGSILDILIVLARHHRFILVLTLVFGLASAGISLVLPPTYQATARIMPPQQSQSGAAALLSSLGGGVASMAAGVSGLKNTSELYVAILQSRTVADRLIARFDLMKHYEAKLHESARKTLAKKTRIGAEKSGMITIEVEDGDSNRAAEIANAYIQELTRLTKTLAVSEASQRRLFFEQQLEGAKNNLAKAEIALKGGIDARGVISVDVESRGVMETVAKLRAQSSAKEIELNSMRSFVTESNPNYRRVQEELASLRSELAKLENGRAGATDLPSETKNQAGLDNIKLLRDVKYYQMLYEMLAKQYEVARLDEAKDPTMIQVLDAALTPEKRSKPQRTLIVLASTIFGFALAAGLVLAREKKKQLLASPEVAARWEEFKSHFRRG